MSDFLVGKNISYKYFKNSKKNILDNVNIAIKKGSTTLLTGKSGCGKSTLAYILAGLYPENGGVLVSGEVLVNGVNIHKLTPNKRVSYVSMMFQNCDLQFCMSNLHQELLLCLENIGIPEEDMPQEIEETVALLGVEELLYRDFNTLSGGEKQKCALCCILILKSKCIILDEAFANVDEKSAKEIIQLIQKLKLTVLVIDHNVELWEGVYDTWIHFDSIKKNTSSQPSTGALELTSRDVVDFVPLSLSVDGAVRNARPAHSACINEELKGAKCEGKSESQNPEEIILETSNLIVNKIHFPDMSFKKGSITAIQGPSGCGKTTFFRTLIKQHKYKGQISFFGQEHGKLKKSQLFNQCGIVFQNPSNQFLALNVFDEILFSVKRWNKNQSQKWKEEKTEELLESFDLARYRKYSPYMLSQGQQRRLAVLSMLAGNQDILLLDEPTYGQDYENIYSIMELLKKKSQEGLTILFNTHNKRVASEFSDAIIYFDSQDM